MEKASIKEVLNGFDDSKFVTPKTLSKFFSNKAKGGSASDAQLNTSLGLTITNKTYSLGSWDAIDITKDLVKAFQNSEGISFENGVIKISPDATFKYIDMRLYMKWLIPWTGSSSLGNRGAYVYRNGVREWQEFITCGYGASSWYGDTYCWLLPVEPGDEFTVAIVRGGTSSLLETNIEHGHILVSATDKVYSSADSSGGGCNCTESYHTYSTVEKKIGTWIDGKTLYEKTISTNVSFSGSVEISHEVSDYDKMWIDLSNSYYNAGKTNLPLIHNSYWGDFTQKTDAMIYNDRVLLYTDGGWGTDWEKVITLRYTK